MQRFFIIAMNCGLLALLLIGLPAATHAQLGDWQIAYAATGRRLLFWGLTIGAAGNIFAGLAIVKGRKKGKFSAGNGRWFLPDCCWFAGDSHTATSISIG